MLISLDWQTATSQQTVIKSMAWKQERFWSDMIRWLRQHVPSLNTIIFNSAMYNVMCSVSSHVHQDISKCMLSLISYWNWNIISTAFKYISFVICFPCFWKHSSLYVISWWCLLCCHSGLCSNTRLAKVFCHIQFCVIIFIISCHFHMDGWLQWNSSSVFLLFSWYISWHCLTWYMMYHCFFIVFFFPFSFSIKHAFFFCP